MATNLLQFTKYTKLLLYSQLFNYTMLELQFPFVLDFLLILIVVTEQIKMKLKSTKNPYLNSQKNNVLYHGCLICKNSAQDVQTFVSFSDFMFVQYSKPFYVTKTLFTYLFSWIKNKTHKKVGIMLNI